MLKVSEILFWYKQNSSWPFGRQLEHLLKNSPNIQIFKLSNLGSYDSNINEFFKGMKNEEIARCGIKYNWITKITQLSDSRIRVWSYLLKIMGKKNSIGS